ncbi:hypothetical protein T492DRAFT_1148178 [Pavlovales sp. CCMP2436]|nr:hypothetical protein T492DRAFT_1148178 [Pavlovales sp. CCMP2436]
MQLAVRTAAVSPMLRQLSTKAAKASTVQRLARGQSTLSAHLDASAQFAGQRHDASVHAAWAAEADRWLAHRRAAEYASDILTAKQLSPFAPPASALSWKDEFDAWTGSVPAVASKLASTSYACVESPSSRPASAAWVDQTQISAWVAKRRAAEHLTDRELVQAATWFK